MFANFDFYNYEESSKNSEIINQKLEDTSHPPSLEDLLILEGITEELQNKNKKLINYFTKEKIKQMLDYIIKEPKEDDYNKGHKFPFVCYKLFNIEEKNIMNFFHMTNKELIEEKNKQLNLSQKNKNNKENIYNQNMNIDNDDDDIGKFYKINPHDNFEDDNFDEVNMDDINFNNNDNNEEDFKDNGDHVNYKDDNINYNELNIYENKKDDEDDLVNVNHNDDKDEDLIDKNKMHEEKEEKKEPNGAENNMELNNENNNNGKIKDDKIINDTNQNEITNNQNNNDKEIKNDSDENKNNIDNKINEDNIDIVNIKDKKDEINDDNNNIKIEEKKEEYPEDQIEILDYFLSFVLTEADLNYVLCGYFSSLMSILLNNYSNIIIKYLFTQRKDILNKLVYHSYRKSIAEILYKILNFEDKLHDNNDDNEEDLNKFSELRLDVIKKIFDIIDINKDTEKISSLSFLVQDLTKNKNIFENIINTNYIINILIKKQLGEFNINSDNGNNNNDINIFNKKNNFIILCDIIILWLNTIKELEMQIPMLLYEVNEDSDEDTVQQKALPNPELHHTILSQALFDILPNLIKNNFNENKNDHNTILQSFNDEKIIPLGLYRIKIVELINNLIIYFRNIPNEFDELIIKTEFIPNLINYIFKYENNNLYQEACLNFFNTLFKKEEDCPYHEKLFDYIFSDLNFFEKIRTNFPKHEKSEGNSGLGYTSFLVSLCYKINTVIGGVHLNLGKSYTKEGIITFIHRAKNPRLNGFNLFFNTKEKNDKENEEIINNNSIIPCLKKYCNDEWKYFFSEQVRGRVALYEENFCDIKNSNNNLSEKDDDLFYNPMNDIDNDNNDNNGEKENLLGFGNKRYFNKDNLNKFSYDDDNDNNNKNLANYKDMEININDFNFNENEKDEKEEDIKDIKDDNNNVNKEEENNDFNSVNYWKNDLEKEKNSYVNIIGEDAMKELLEE